MPPATVHGVGLYFVIFAAFKESVTLNLAQRSFKVIDFGTNLKRVYTFLLVVNSNLDLISHRFYRATLCGLCDRNSVCPSVRPSVRHTRGLCSHGSTYDHDFFTTW